MDANLFEVSYQNSVPADARHLMWRVFFLSRNRTAISLSQHYPWIEKKNASHCILIRNPLMAEGKNTIAALAMKETLNTEGAHFGMIGLVCVDDKYRGRGLCSMLINQATKAAINLNWRALILWTQNPNIYLNKKFNIWSRELLAEVVNYSYNISDAEFDLFFQSCTTDGLDPRGLPSFATDIRVLKNNGARASVVKGLYGYSVVEWEGLDNDVAEMLLATMPKFWSINFQDGDGLIKVLSEKNIEIAISEASTMMGLYLDNSTPMPLPKIRILDRI